LLRQDTQPASTAMPRISTEDLETILGAIDPHYLPEDKAGRMRFYERGGFRDLPELPKLALRWFEEIGSRGPKHGELWFSKRRPSEEARYGIPDFLYHEDTLETPPLDEVYPVRVGDSQTLLMWRDSERTPEGYKRMIIRDEFYRADMAILAVLTIMEADHAEPKTPYKYAGNEPELDFAEALLRYYRDNFDSLTPDVQKDLKVETYKKIYDFLESLRLLIAYLEDGKPREGVTRKPLTTFRRDVRAAELKHIEGLKNHEIAEKLNAEGLGLEEPKDYRDEAEKKEKYARKARDSAKRGKERYLEKALGEKKLRQHFTKAKAEMEHFKKLDEVDRLMWTLADKSEYVRTNIVRKNRGDRNKDKRDNLRDLLFRLLQGERSLLERVDYHSFNPTRIISSPAADEPAPNEDKKA
jgi:hypothetical protein